jgi:hypothetical protein
LGRIVAYLQRSAIEQKAVPHIAQVALSMVPSALQDLTAAAIKG